MILLATALGGVWSLEQPSGSLAEYYPSFREMLRNIFDIGGPTAVWVPMLSIELYCRLALFMCTISTVVDVPLLGAYTKAPLSWEFQNHSFGMKKKADHKTVEHYVDKQGKRRWKGTKSLKSTEIPGFNNFNSICMLSSASRFLKPTYYDRI